jgi:Sigma-54 interaction domain
MQNRDASLLRGISAMANSNPFSPERFEFEKKLLGKKFVQEDAIAWNRRPDSLANDRPNVVELTRITSEVVERARLTIANGVVDDPEILSAYWDASSYLLLYRHFTVVSIGEWLQVGSTGSERIARAWDEFLTDYRHLLDMPAIKQLIPGDPAHLFACLSQIHRAFFNIFDHILGDSLPVANLRARIWESIFSGNVRRFHSGLWARMNSVATLITGPSGTGKELVARAIGLSSYIPFQAGPKKFDFQGEQEFFPVNLSALSRTLVESELFGHRKGAFTGATSDRKGWLESCGKYGSVFLDEIGELDGEMQVKLLRTIQQRTYSRIGESQERKFHGKVIAATNRDLSKEVSSGRFREDLYYRICSDRIETPSLRSQLDHNPDDLRFLVQNISSRNFPGESFTIANEAMDWIAEKLGPEYPWSGNIRELEQCIWNLVIHGSYVPLGRQPDERASIPGWARQAIARSLTADELLGEYCAWVYAECGSYEASAERLGIDRRTVKAKIDEMIRRRNGRRI